MDKDEVIKEQETGTIQAGGFRLRRTLNRLADVCLTGNSAASRGGRWVGARYPVTGPC